MDGGRHRAARSGRDPDLDELTPRTPAYGKFANVAGAFTLGEPPLPGPVLLIDDLVDSGWTLTEIGQLLSRSGSGPVYPLVLAVSTGRRS